MARPSTGPRLRPDGLARRDRDGSVGTGGPRSERCTSGGQLGRPSRRRPEARLSLPQGGGMTEPHASSLIAASRMQRSARRPVSRCSRLRGVDKTGSRNHGALCRLNVVYARQASGKLSQSIYSIIYLMRIMDWGNTTSRTMQWRCCRSMKSRLQAPPISTSEPSACGVPAGSGCRERRTANCGGPAIRAMPDQSDDGSCSVDRRPVAQTRGPLGGPSPDLPQAWLTAVQPLWAGSRSRLAHRAISANTPQPR